MENIRNFSIIAHIDHGKSTLADRLLELTGTVEKRKMKEQVLDQMELERERGITIKMQPVRMLWHPQSQISKLKTQNYQLNLIDTPGHIDFSYEVSRALKAVEGAVLLVDAAQGVQAQTIANVEIAKEAGLVIIPVLNKIDLASARIEETEEEIRRLLGYGANLKILRVSAKTGEGVGELLEEIIRVVPPPKREFPDKPRALIFDFEYSNHQGVIIFVRVVDGQIKKGDKLALSQTGEKFTVGEVGVFSPNRVPSSVLNAGEIGYIVTNIKEPSVATVGDSVVSAENPLPPLAGYLQPKPVVWASVYPESQDKFDDLRQALDRLRLSDSSLAYEEESSGSLGRGFRCGFLGMLHLEIVTERLRREFGLDIVIASPTITYKVQFIDGGEKEIYSPVHFPDDHLIKKIFEPWVDMRIIAPPDMFGSIMQILHEHEAEIGETEQFGGGKNGQAPESGNRVILNVKMPLRELMRNFFDELKSVTAGYASLNYKIAEMREALPGSITRLDVLVAEDVVPAFSRIVSSAKIQREADDLAEKLKKILPRALFSIKIQVRGLGRILASRALPALKKNVTGHLYGGDRSRKMKLWQKQKKGKKRLKEMGKVNIPHDVFVRMIQSN
ncbi:MAG: elongation factor 4 [bacterium]|nr:elongation factor 4 [bacterium]